MTLLAQATSVTLDMNTIILAVIGLMGTSITGYLALRMAALAQDAKESKENMKEIHVAVNSAKTALETKLEDFSKQNVELSKKLATMEEAHRGAELAKALATVPGVAVTAMPVVPLAAPAVAPVAVAAPTTVAAMASPSGKLNTAIVELHEAAKETLEAADKTVVIADKVVKTS